MATSFAGCLDSGSEDEGGTDTTPPYVSMTSPGSSRVSGVVTVEVETNDRDSGIALIEFRIDGDTVQEGTSDSFAWDTEDYDNGDHEVEARATDGAGNVGTDSRTFEVENVHNADPVAVIGSPDEGDVLDADAEVALDGTASRDDDGDYLMLIWYLDTVGDPIAYGEEASVSIPAGEHEVLLVVDDGRGGSDTASVGVLADTRPHAGIRAPAKDSVVRSRQVALDASPSVDDDGDDLEYTWTSDIDGEVYQGHEAKVTVTLSSGGHRMTLRAEDEHGLADDASVRFRVNLAPTARIDAPEDGSSFAEGTEISFDAGGSSDPEGDDLTFTWTSDLDGELYSGAGETFSGDLSLGDHAIQLMVEDAWGGEDADTIPVSVEETANERPEVEITSPAGGALLTGIAEIAGGASDPEGDIASVEVRIDDGPWNEADDDSGDWTSWSIGWDTAGYDGDRTVVARSTDGEGTYSIVHEVDVTVDNVAPEVAIASPEDGATVAGTVDVEATAEDATTDVEYVLFIIGGEAVQNGSATAFEWDTTAFDDGDVAIEVRAEDSAGLVGTDSMTVTVDNQEVDVDITDPPAGAIVGGEVDVEVTVETDGDVEDITFSIDGEEVQSGTSDVLSWDTTSVADGDHTVNVTARDSNDAVGHDEIGVIVDNTPPEVRVISPEDMGLVRGAAWLTADVDDASPTPWIEWSVDGDPIDAGLSVRWDTTGVDDGTHEVTVEATDAAGNANSTSIDVVVDNTAPSVEVTSPAEDHSTTADMLTINATATDANGIADVEFFIDSSLVGHDDAAPFSVTVDISAYGQGSHEVLAVAIDAAGNAASDTVQFTITDGGDEVIDEPSEYLLTEYSTAGKTRLVLEEENWRGVPVASSLLGNRGVSASVEWSPSPTDDLAIADTDASLFSGRLALSYWDEPSHAIVAETYEDALLAVPLATFLDAPVLLEGSRTDEALWRLGTRHANEIICVGDTSYNDIGGVTVLDKEVLLTYTLAVAAAKGIAVDYMVVAYPGDDASMSLDDQDNDDNYARHISAFAGQFAAYHDAVLLTCEGSTVDARRTYLNSTVHEWRDAVEERGNVVDYLLMVGDYYSLPMIKRPYTINTVNGGNQTKYIPSDNYYLNKYGDAYAIEVAGGRIVAKGLSNMSMYIDRIVNYEDYLATDTPPASPEWSIYAPIYPAYKDWNVNALIYQGNMAEFAADSEQAVRNMLHDDGGFHTLDDSALAKTCTNSGDARIVLMDDFANSNFIAIDADHGEPHQCTLTFTSEDIVDLNPGVIFGVSCMLGQIDDTNHLPSGDDSEVYDVNRNTSMTYTFLERGIAVFMGATRTALGSFGASTIIGMVDYVPYQSPGLCYLYFENLINGSMDSGSAMRKAKTDLYGMNQDEGNRYTIWEYVHYGDPAFDPWDPRNDGN
ncbi:MAG: Ig-like domain-containing protein [Thermoplasmata archaeon]|nr:Ig-like domain-containing protein [Thermoplasmata archaeon]